MKAAAVQLVPIPGSAHEFAVRTMTLSQLRGLGLRKMVYLKCVMHEGEPLVLIHGADGTPVESPEVLTTARELITAHGFRLMTVH